MDKLIVIHTMYNDFFFIFNCNILTSVLQYVSDHGKLNITRIELCLVAHEIMRRWKYLKPLGVAAVLFLLLQCFLWLNLKSNQVYELFDVNFFQGR